MPKDNAQRDTNPDLITRGPGSHPVAAGVGTAAAGMAGAEIDPTGTEEYWKENHKTRAYADGVDYAQLLPAYRFGAALADSDGTAGFDETRARAIWELSSDRTVDFDRVVLAIRDEFDRKMKLREERLPLSDECVRAWKESFIVGEIEMARRTVADMKILSGDFRKETI